jgi:hypothetical protein
MSEPAKTSETPSQKADRIYAEQHPEARGVDEVRKGPFTIEEWYGITVALRAELERFRTHDEAVCEALETRSAALKKAEEENERLRKGNVWCGLCCTTNDGTHGYGNCVPVHPAEARAVTLEKALREIMGLLDSGYLVRDISHDHENGWAMKQIAPVMILREAAAALKEKP